jgi:hypothetical protein
MYKPRIHWHLDQALFVLLIMAGAVVSAVLDVQAISAATASGRYGLGAGQVASAKAKAKAKAPASAASAVSFAAVVARLTH